jgi:hypothetical protein
MSKPLLDLDVTWDGNVGDVKEGSFEENLPDGITIDTVNNVHSYEDQYAASVCNAVVKRAKENGIPEGEDLTIMDTPMGAYASVGVTMNSDHQLVAAIVTDQNECLAAIQLKAKDMMNESVDS